MNQRGVALIAGLALLAALSLLALVATSGMILQQHMAANYHENKLALENSAIATTFATAWLYSRANHERQKACVSDCLLPVAIHNVGEIPAQAEYQGSSWWQSNGIEVGVNPESGESMGDNPGTGAVPPLWILEELHFVAAENVDDGDPFEGVGYYRILSRGTGTQAGKIAVTESIVARPWGGDYQLDVFPPEPEASNFCLQFAGKVEEDRDCGRLAWRQRR
jgi:Tfp pilus assembly protein PilX